MTKKHLLLLPLIGFAGASFAQSSVTLFGVVDATIAHGSGSIASRTQLTRGGYNSNRIGFRGTEDLGGGMSAGFWLESGMNLDDGAGQATNINNQTTGGALAGLNGGQGLTFARRSTVSLMSKSWGEIRLGRDYVPQYWNHVYGDPFGNVGVGAAISYTANISGVTNTRASNSIGWLSPTWSGFALQLMHYRGENASNVANDNDGNGNGIRATYAAGPISVGLGWGKTEYLAGDMTQRNVNASYNFGVVRLMGTYNRDTTGAIEARGGVIGVVAPIGPGEVKASWSTYKTDAAGSPKTTKVAVGYVHNLSKRTALYATYARNSNSGGAAQALNGGITAANASASGFDLGLRHSF